MGGGESGVMCRKLSEVEKIECIFSIFSVKNSTNLSARSFIVEQYTVMNGETV